MFIGLTAGCISSQPESPRSGGGGSPSWLVGYTTNGSYPAGIQAGDLVVYCTHDVGIIPAILGFTTISSGTFNVTDTYSFGYRIATGSLSGSLLTGYANLIINLRGFTGITGGAAAPNSGSWATLSALTAGSNILALGYSSSTAATIGTGFTTQLGGPGLILATKDTPEPTTSFTYTGFSNTGTAKICYSLGVK